MQTQTVEWAAVRSLYAHLIEAEAEEKPEALIPSLESILNGELDPTLPLEKIAIYQERLGSTLSSSPTGHAFFNGKHFDVNDVRRLKFI